MRAARAEARAAQRRKNDAAMDAMEPVGGDPACWLHDVCDECGAIVDDRNPHRAGCSHAPATAATPAAAPASPSEPRWIPASPVAAGLAFQLLAWIVVATHAAHPSAPLALAWVHAVAIGWLTTIALSVLIRILPNTTDRPWRFESVARASLAGVAGGAALIVAGFLVGTTVLAVGGAVVVVSAAAYLVAAIATLAQPGGGRRERAIAVALRTTLGALGLTVLAGFALAVMLAAGRAPSPHLLLAHATLGIVAWLTVLTTGVAARTLRVILDADARSPRTHAGVGVSLVLGAVLVVLSGPYAVVATAGFGVIELGALLFAIDAVDRAMRSTTPNTVARVGVAFAAGWIVIAGASALEAAVGVVDPALPVVAALVGWIGSMMLAHLHHIGVRLIATSVIGEDDETPPEALLSQPTAIASVLVYEIAAVALAVAAAGGAASSAPREARASELIAALCGIVATALIATNIAIAVRRARRVPAVRA